MPSSIDPNTIDTTQPPAVTATTAGVRAVFAAIKALFVIAKAEISAIQAAAVALTLRVVALEGAPGGYTVFEAALPPGMSMGEIAELTIDSYPLDERDIQFSALIENGLAETNLWGSAWFRDTLLPGGGCSGHLVDWGGAMPAAGTTITNDTGTGTITGTVGGDATAADAIVLDAIVEPDPGVASVWLPSCVGPGVIVQWTGGQDPPGGWRARRKPGSTTVCEFKFGGGGDSPALAWAQVRIPAT